MSRGITLRCLALYAAVGCAHDTASRRTTGESETSAPRKDDGVVSSPCTLHAGEVETKTRRWRSADGELSPPESDAECAYNAECTKERGVSTPGDGSIALRCRSGTCVCVIEVFEPAASKREFSFEAECTSGDQARELLSTRCMALTVPDTCP